MIGQSALEVVAEISVGVENFRAAEATASLFFLDVFREDVSEFAAMLDVLDFKHRTGLIPGMNLDGAESEELLTKRAFYR